MESSVENREVDNPSKLSLTVFEAYTKDVGLNRIRMPFEDMEKLGVQVGDAVLIKSKNKIIVSEVQPTYVDEADEETCKIDLINRINLEIDTGDKVRVIKSRPEIADKVTINLITRIGDDELIIDEMKGKYFMGGMRFNIPYSGERVEFLITTQMGRPSMIGKDTEVIVEESKWYRLVNKKEEKLVKSICTDIIISKREIVENLKVDDNYISHVINLLSIANESIDRLNLLCTILEKKYYRKFDIDEIIRSVKENE